jgi:hypothetical protein
LKTRDKYILKNCFKLGSLLLVVLFLSISVIQALHYHKSNSQTEQSANNDDEKVSDSDQCQLCDYLTHKQGKELFIAYQAAIVLPVPNLITFHPHSFVGNYKFTLQGFTNKGPPTIFS